MVKPCLLTTTFTTAAFDRSSLWLFGASPCRATPRGLPSSFVQHEAHASSWHKQSRRLYGCWPLEGAFSQPLKAKARTTAKTPKAKPGNTPEIVKLLPPPRQWDPCSLPYCPDHRSGQ